MSDASFGTALVSSGNVSEDRSAINARDALSRYGTVRNVSASETLAQNCDVALVDSSSGAVTLTLPDAPTDGDRYIIILVEATNSVTVQANSGGSDTMIGSGVSSDAYTDSTLWDVSEVIYDATNTRWVKLR